MPAAHNQISRAFQIADESMTELITAHLVPLDKDGCKRFGLVDANSQEVASIDDADPAAQEAFTWLKSRGLASLESDGNGQFIRLHARQPTPMPEFDEIRDKRISELTPVQRSDAREMWLRNNWAHFPDIGEHMKFLLDRLDATRSALGHEPEEQETEVPSPCA